MAARFMGGELSARPGVPRNLHVIPLRMFQLLKSKRWNSADFRVLQGVVGGELRAELVIVRVVPSRSPRLCL